MTNSRPRGANFKLFGLIVPILIVLFVMLSLFRAQVSYALHTGALAIGKLIWPVSNIGQEPSNVQVARDEAIAKENDELKRALGHFSGNSPHLAFVLSSLRSSPYETIIIDQGSAAGVTYGQKVNTEDNIAFGEVVEVYENMSKIQLYSAYGRELEVVLPDGTHVLASGAGSQNFVLKLPRGLVVSARAQIMLPSANNLILAEIQDVKESAGDAFQVVYARSPANVYSLSRVYVEN